MLKGILFLKKMGTLKNESITRLCLVPQRRWGQKLLMLFFSNLQKCNLEKFLRLVLLDLVAVFIFLIKFQMKFYQKKYQLLQKKLSKNKIKKWNSMWRLKKFSEGARRNFEKFFNTTLNCCIKKHNF
jgi:hypothetical protein